MIEAMIASRSAVKRPKMGFTMPKKHVLAISAVVVVAVAAAWLIPGRNKAPTTTGAPTEQAQLPLGKPTPNVEFANSGQPTNLPMVGQPVMRGPLAEEAGGISEGDDGVPVEGSSATPPTVTTTAPPCRRTGRCASDAGCSGRQASSDSGADRCHRQACSGDQACCTGASRQTSPGCQACGKTSRHRCQGRRCWQQLVQQPAYRQLCGTDPRHQLRSQRSGVRQRAGRPVPLFQESAQRQASLRDHLRQLPKPRRSRFCHQSLASEGSGW